MMRKVRGGGPGRAAYHGSSMGWRIVAGAAVSLLSVAGLGEAAATSAAVNPEVSNTSTHSATIAADGSYRLVLDQTVQLASDSSIGFGGTVPDGFRLPDEDGPLPPYLRPEYGDGHVVIDGDSDRVGPQRVHHRVDYTNLIDGTEGVHRGLMSFEVRGAALPTTTAISGSEDAGAAVHVRPLRRGELRVTSAEEIIGADCFTVPPLSIPCGHCAGDSWVIPADEFGPDGSVRVLTALDPKGLAPTAIDEGMQVGG